MIRLMEREAEINNKVYMSVTFSSTPVFSGSPGSLITAISSAVGVEYLMSQEESKVEKNIKQILAEMEQTFWSMHSNFSGSELLCNGHNGKSGLPTLNLANKDKFKVVHLTLKTSSVYH